LEKLTLFTVLNFTVLNQAPRAQPGVLSNTR